nr:LytTR family DNA-binding domain-containing protein [Amylibacter sp.]
MNLQENAPKDRVTLSRVFRGTYRQMRHPLTFIVTSASAGVCALVGPFDTYSTDTFVFRLFFWGVIAFSSCFWGTVVAIWTNLRFPDQLFWVRAAIGVGLFSLPYFSLAWSFALAFYHHDELPHPAIIFILVMVVDIFVYLGIWVCHAVVDQQAAQITTRPASVEPAPIEPDPARATAPEPVEPPQPHAPPKNCPFLKRLGPNGGSYLIRLSMSDHYIEAYTDTGMHMVYMRFGDAITELNPQAGAKVHRSHWVRFAEISEVIREGQKVSLLMSDGVTVPISRSRKKVLQDKGII